MGVQSWDELLCYVQDRLLFRGHESAKWFLKITLERTCERIDPDLLRANKREDGLLREFRGRFHDRQRGKDEPGEYPSLLKLAQLRQEAHYTLITI